MSEKELKSKKVLTELLDNQIDVNEKLIEENLQYSSQQKKFLALISKKEKKIEEMRTKLQKNAKPLFISLSILFLKPKIEVFQYLKQKEMRNYQKSLFSKIITKNYERNLQIFFSKLKKVIVSKKFSERNYLFGIKTLKVIWYKMNQKKQFDFLRILKKTSIIYKNKTIQYKLNKIAAFKLFYFNELIEKIMCRKKLDKYFLMIWSSKTKNFSNNYQNLARFFNEIFNKIILRRKKNAFFLMKEKKCFYKEKILIFIIKINAIFCNKIHFYAVLTAFHQIKAHSKKNFEKIQKSSKIITIFEYAFKRFFLKKLKKNNSKISHFKKIVILIKKCLLKQTFKHFILIKTVLFRVPDFFLSHICRKNKMNNLKNKRKNLQKIEISIKKNIKKNQKGEKSKIKRKLIVHENAVKEYFQSKKQDLETYFSTILNIMKDSQENLKLKNEESEISFRENKKFQQESNIKLLEENQVLEKKLLEKNETLKVQFKEKEKYNEILKKYGNSKFNSLKILFIFFTKFINKF